MRVMMRLLLTLSFFLFARITHVCAQEVEVRSGFFSDSVKIGEPSGFYLSASYPSTANVLFPDSAFNFAPFEFDRKKYFATETNDGRSYDSVVYYLSTFELDKIQTLSLPIFQLNPQDCTVFESKLDSVQLMLSATDIPDTVSLKTLPLKMSLAYENVPYDFNYPVFFLALTVVLVAATIAWFVFGKKILRYLRLKRLLKAHRQFMKTFSSLIDGVSTTFSPASTENTMLFWRKYMEQLETKPFTKLTTTEMLRIHQDDVLDKNLHAIDSAIYGHNTSVVESLHRLKTYTDERFTNKLEELKRGQ
jgi:hypothetical protein